MKVFVNFPKDEEGIKEFQNASNVFLATIIVETIKSMNVDNLSKRKLLDNVVERAREMYHITE
ncbi:MAG: hypothetical protein FWF08_02880 [Oscillospiraceae bacterium]|nr:hypothetical protein [Oscillospiraceae bacterium]